VGTRDEVMAALHSASARFVDLVESLRPDDADRPVAGLEWNVAQTVAHVLTVVRRGFADRRRSASVDETAALNQTVLDELGDLDLRALGAQLRADARTALDVVFPKVADDRVFPFHGGVTTTMTPALHIVLGEYVVHGFDVARAVDRPWPISADEARLLVPGELLGTWLRPGVPNETYEVRLDGLAPARVVIRDGRVVPDGDGSAVDVVIAVAPAEFVLGFYNRIPATDEGLRQLQSRFLPS
jgi:uncharacterized protein (TIGR03083 family)